MANRDNRDEKRENFSLFDDKEKLIKMLIILVLLGIILFAIFYPRSYSTFSGDVSLSATSPGLPLTATPGI